MVGVVLGCFSLWYDIILAYMRLPGGRVFSEACSLSFAPSPLISRPRLGNAIVCGYLLGRGPAGGGIRTDCDRALAAPLISWAHSGKKPRMTILGRYDSARCFPEMKVSRMTLQSDDRSLFLASAVFWRDIVFARAILPPWSPRPILNRPSCSRLASFPAPYPVPGDTVARDPGYSCTRHWRWIAFHGDSSSPWPCVCRGGGDEIGPPGVANPLRLDGYRCQRYASPPSSC